MTLLQSTNNFQLLKLCTSWHVRTNRVCQEFFVDFFLHFNEPGYQIVAFLCLIVLVFVLIIWKDGLPVIKCSNLYPVH